MRRFAMNFRWPKYRCLPLYLMSLMGIYMSAHCFAASNQDVLNKHILQAVEVGKLSAIKALVQEGADPETPFGDGEPAWMAADSRDVMKFFIDNGAKINEHVKSGEDASYTALILAAWRGHLDVCRFLLNHGADVNAATRSGNSVLMKAVDSGNAAEVLLLIQRGAKVNAQDSGGTTALSEASVGKITLSGTTSNAAVMRVLLDHGAKINIQGMDGSTALMTAAQFGTIDMVELLLKRGADAKAKDSVGCTALVRAKQVSADQRDRLPIVRLLLKWTKISKP